MIEFLDEDRNPITTPCQRNPDAWFGIVGEKNMANETKRSIHICKTMCPVTQVCLDSAIEREAGLPLPHRYGIWGGTTPQQRYKMSKQ